jgi:hypothetical protein
MTDRDAFTTYRMADGSQIYGEFSFVTETEFFDDYDGPIAVIKEEWRLASRTEVVFKPSWWVEEVE